MPIILSFLCQTQQGIHHSKQPWSIAHIPNPWAQTFVYSELKLFPHLIKAFFAFSSYHLRFIQHTSNNVWGKNLSSVLQICSIFIKGSLLTSKSIYCLEVSERLSSRSGETQGMFQWWYLLFNKRSPLCIECQSIIICQVGDLS